MGSFLLNCGVSNSVLKENTPITLVFLTRPIKDSKGFVSTEIFQDWMPENFIIEGVQQDYGCVDIDEKYRPHMEYLMTLLYKNGVDSPESWKKKFKEIVGKSENLKDMSFNDVSEAFGELLRLMQNSQVYYKNDIMDMTSQMKVAHVDQVVINSIKESPIYFDASGFVYNGERDYSRNVISDLNNFTDYLVLKNKKKFQDYVNKEFFSGLDNFGDFDVEGSLNLLIHTSVYVPMEDRTVEHVVKEFVRHKKTNIFFTYANLMGVRFSPSIYASQDYSNYKGKNYQNMMKAVFAKQKARAYEDEVERSFDRKIDLNGLPIGDDITYEDYEKSFSQDIYMNCPDVIVTEDTKMLTKDAEGYEFLNKKVIKNKE